MENKIIQIIDNSDIYYYMPDGFYKECEYTNEVKEIMKSSDLFLFDNFIVDIARLRDEINFDCFNCHKINSNVCCNGAPGLFTKDVYDMVSENLYSIIRTCFSDIEISEMIKCGVMSIYVDENGNEVGKPLTYIDEENDGYKCAFLMTNDNGSKLCAIRKWCYENGNQITDFCNFECLLFPLEIFVLRNNNGDEHILITSVIDGVLEKYCRWGVDDSTEYMCFGNCKRREMVNNEKIFRHKDYITVYEAFEELISIWFGKQVYVNILEVII